MADDTGPEAEWLNMTRAAHRLGWPRERLRGLVRRHRLQTMRGNSGEMLVRMTPELLAQATPGPPHGPASPDSLGQPPRAAHGPEEVDELRDRLAVIEADRDRLRDELMAARERAARAEGEAAAQRDSRDRERDLVRELRQELLDARRPWWRRWLA